MSEDISSTRLTTVRRERDTSETLFTTFGHLDSANAIKHSFTISPLENGFWCLLRILAILKLTAV